MKRDFITRFPFDVINLDSSDIFSGRRSDFPARWFAHLEKCSLGSVAGMRRDGAEYRIDEFTLMFTTRVTAQFG